MPVSVESTAPAMKGKKNLPGKVLAMAAVRLPMAIILPSGDSVSALILDCKSTAGGSGEDGEGAEPGVDGAAGTGTIGVAGELGTTNGSAGGITSGSSPAVVWPRE